MQSGQTMQAPAKLIGGKGQRQVQLPLRKAFAIALQNIRVRFWRSMITATGVLLGIAFLGSTFGQSMIESRTPLRNEKGISAAALKIQQQEAQMRQAWLVSMSLIVCTVGICNSMLMSVTERFKEIGTMKCLGALDNFIVKLFLLEACFLGIIASVIGFIIGFGGAVIAGFITNGPEVWKRIPLSTMSFTDMGMLEAFVFSVTAGMVLTVLATIFPSVKAAQLPPAAALRSEI